MLTRVASRLQRLAAQLLLVGYINRLVFAVRFLYFTRIRKSLRSYDDDSKVIAHGYSLDMLRKGRTSDRPLRLIRPLSVIDAVPKDGKVLSVGSRFETELLYLVGHGFRARNVRGLDMISYSPWIDVGNMHAMPYEDDSFDVVVLGWVLAYSEDPAQAAKETLRVAKEGAFVAIGVSYYPDEQLEALESRGTIIGGRQSRIQTVDGLLGLFGTAVERVYYRHDPPSDREGACTVVFSVTKEGDRR